MNIGIQKKIFCILSGLFLLGAIPSWADPILFPLENFYQEKGRIFLRPRLQAYSTQFNYDRLGTRIAPQGLLHYNRYNLDIPAAIGMSDFVTAFGRMHWVFAQVQLKGYENQSWGLGDQSAGLSFKIHQWQRGTKLIFQGQFDLPAYSNPGKEKKESPLIGNGTFDFNGSAFLSYPWIQRPSKTLDLDVGVGITARSDGFPGMVPWSGRLRYHVFPQGIILGASLNGFISLGQEANKAAGNPCPNGKAAGGSCYILSPNPSLMMATAELGYRMSPEAAVIGNIGGSLWGKQTPQGFYGGVGVEIRLGRTRPSEKAVLSPEDYGKSNQGFVNYAFDAKVIKVNDRFNLIKIDKGALQGVSVGQIMDIFSAEKGGQPKEAVARARVTSVRDEEAALKILEYYKETWIEEGFTVKRPLN